MTLTQAQVQELFTYENGVLYWKKRLSNCIHIGTPVLNKNDRGYIRVRIYGKLYKAHRIIYLYHYGTLPDMIDHINQNKTDNRIENLRPTNKSLNGLNSTHKNKKWCGVYLINRGPYKGKFQAAIHIDGQRNTLGKFTCKHDAAQAYNFAVYRYCKEWGVYNVP